MKIHPVKFARFGAAFALDAWADSVLWVEEGLARMTAVPDRIVLPVGRVIDRVRTTLEALAVQLDPGEEYVPLVKPLLDYLADDQWGETDYELARSVIARTSTETEVQS